jgi:hypothetical protein
MKSNDLKSTSPITFIFERIFFILQYTSPIIWFTNTRTFNQKRYAGTGKFRDATIKRGKKIELYLFIWLLILLVFAISVAKFNLFSTIIVYICLFRVFELTQSAINMNIFDPLRMEGKVHYISGITRTIVISIWNYLELLFCFAIVYSARIAELHNARDWTDAYYFSAITQLTIGYGDLVPNGMLRIIAPIQGFVGFLFAIFVFARFITMLPGAKAVQGDDKKNI